MDPRAEVVAEFYRAFCAREWDTVSRLFAEDAEFGLGGRGPVAGSYRGPEAALTALRRLIDETDGTLGPVREGTWDICTSDHHVILIEWLQATRKGRSATFYVHLVCAVENKTIKRAFASFDDQYEFDGLWT